MRTQAQILRALKSGPKSFWELINMQDSHIVEFLENIKELLNQGVIEYRDYKFHLKQDVPYQPKKDVVCSVCGTGVEIKGFFRDIYERFLEETKNRPLPVSEYDQGFIRPIDTIKRVAFIYERGDLENREIFILGDDDLLSIAIGLTKMAKRVTVVEIDERINKFIEDFCERNGIDNIEVKRYNVIDDLPDEAKGKYDVFITDPVETAKGLFLFIARCMEALKGTGSAGYMGFTHLEASLKKWARFEKFMLDANFVITDIIRDLAYYPERDNQWIEFYKTYELVKHIDLPIPPDVDWYRSSFVRFEAVDKPNIPEVKKISSFEELYFDDESWATPRPTK